jgi:cytochrome c553
MSAERIFSFKNIWFTASVGGLITVAVLAALIGLIWVPSVQNDKTGNGLWDAICSAAGAAVSWRPAQQPTAPISRPSDVIVTAQMMSQGDSLSIGRGATLALRCTMCHGARGVSEADSPNLAGQYSAAIYKQLRDFKAGHRQSVIMGPLVKDLSDQDMRDLSAYYAYLPLPRSYHPAGRQPQIPAIVQNGDPMRNIAVCGSCHGGIDNKTSSPWLDGEPASYIAAQLRAFATGARRNDINEQMRNVARQMTPEEIDAVAGYYSSR